MRGTAVGEQRKAREKSGSEISQLQFGEGKVTPHTVAAVRTETTNRSLESITDPNPIYSQ